MLTGIKAVCFTFLIWGKHDVLFIFTLIDRVHWVFTACLLYETAAIFLEKMSAVPLLNVVNVHFWARQLSRKLRKCCSGALWREENQSSEAVMTQHKSSISCHVSFQSICNKWMILYAWVLGLITPSPHPEMQPSSDDYIWNHNKEVEAERTSVQSNINLRLE